MIKNTPYYKMTPEQRLDRHAEFDRKRTERLRRMRDKYATDEEYRTSIRSNVLRSKFGITLEDRDAMLAAQGGVCASCGESDVESWNVDHCHQTGKIRGILCGHCNRMLGQAKDDPERLRRGAEYLERSRD